MNPLPYLDPSFENGSLARPRSVRKTTFSTPYQIWDISTYCSTSCLYCNPPSDVVGIANMVAKHTWNPLTTYSSL
jgi:hypothetical protein